MDKINLPSDTLCAPDFHDAEPACFSWLGWTGGTVDAAGVDDDDDVGPDWVLVDF